MDPTIELCRIKYSFDIIETPKPEYPPAFRLLANLPLPGENITRENGKTFTPPPLFVDAERYRLMQSLKDQYDNPKFENARNKSNPFEYLGNSIFLNRAAIKLANIDAIYNISRHLGAFANFQTGDDFVFADIAAGPGSFTQYFQWRRPNSLGYGITLKGPLDWNMTVIDPTKFIPYYGPDNTGDLYVNWKSFSDMVLTYYPAGINVVTGDGGFDVDKGQFNRQEYLSSRLILTECLVALLILEEGGDFVCKMFDTVTKISADTLYIMARCFEEITLFKPVSSRPANAERYLVCKRRKQDIRDEIELLKRVIGHYKGDMMLTGFLTDLPPDFNEWLIGENKASIERQINLAEQIITLMNDENAIEIPKYDIHRCFLYWNIPDNPINKRSRIKI